MDEGADLDVIGPRQIRSGGESRGPGRSEEA